jgi:hypothetical protein
MGQHFNLSLHNTISPSIAPSLHSENKKEYRWFRTAKKDGHTPLQPEMEVDVSNFTLTLIWPIKSFACFPTCKERERVGAYLLFLNTLESSVSKQTSPGSLACKWDEEMVQSANQELVQVIGPIPLHRWLSLLDAHMKGQQHPPHMAAVKNRNANTASKRLQWC